jgi:hypothetical protein
VKQLLVLSAGLRAMENIHHANKTKAVFTENPSSFRGTCDCGFMQQESAEKEHVPCRGKGKVVPVLTKHYVIKTSEGVDSRFLDLGTSWR